MPMAVARAVMMSPHPVLTSDGRLHVAGVDIRSAGVNLVVSKVYRRYV